MKEGLRRHPDVVGALRALATKTLSRMLMMAKSEDLKEQEADDLQRFILMISTTYNPNPFP
jgi:hypothetical protein